MRTKLSLFCDRLMEAGWLAAVLVVPILFSVYTSHRFVVNKVCLVRSLALVMSLAWVVRTVERSPASGEGEDSVSLRRRIREFLARPLVLPALLMVCITLLSTLTSIWPHGSLWGTYDRRQGALTTLSYIVIAMLLLALLRSERQVERLIRAIVLGSLPVCLYALAQHLELAPRVFVVYFEGAGERRWSSSLGNPIFLGAYLIMVVPVTLSQILRSFRGLLADRRHLISGLCLTGIYGLLLATQLYVLVLTRSRGPFLALLVGLLLFVMLWALHAGQHAVGLAVLIVALLAGAALVAINLSDTLSNPLRDLPYVGRLSTIAGPGVLKTRTLIWQGAVDLSSASPARLILGYGPESMDLAFYGHYPPELLEGSRGPGVTADRSHNVVLDALVSTGLIGAAIYLLLFYCLLSYGLRALGLIEGGRQRRIFAAVLGGGGVVGLLGAWLAGGAKFVGVGVSAGLLAGLLAYATLFLLGLLERGATGARQPLLVIALLAAVVAHFVEVQVGIPVTATRLCFWVFAGILASEAKSVDGKAWLARHGPRASVDFTAQVMDDRARKRSDYAETSGSAGLLQPGLSQLLPSALMVGLLLISTAFGFVTHLSDLRGNPFTVVFLLLIWLPSGLIILGETSAEAQRKEVALSWINCLAVYAVPSLLSLLLFGLPYLLVLRQFPSVTAIPFVFYLSLFAALVSTGIALLGDSPLCDRFWRDDVWWFYPILALVALGLVMAASVNLVRADVCFLLGGLYEGAERWDESVAFYEQAVGFAPAQDHYYRFLGHAYLKNAQLNTPQRPAWFGKAEETLERAVQISPLNPDHRGNLGNLYHAWADVTEEPGQKVEKLRMALARYQESVSVAPQTHGRLLEDAVFEAHVSLATALGRLGQTEDAVEEAWAARNVAPAGREQEAEELVAAMEALGQ